MSLVCGNALTSLRIILIILCFSQLIYTVVIHYERSTKYRNGAKMSGLTSETKCTTHGDWVFVHRSTFSSLPSVKPIHGY